MTKRETIEAVKKVCRLRRLSLATERTYAGWIARFCAFRTAHAVLSSEECVRLFLENLAPCSAASTQNQALNAVVFLYRDVLCKPLGTIGQWARAKVPKRLPSWLEQEEMDRLIGALNGGVKLMAQVAYGGGLRIAELLQLRVKDMDIAGGTVTVRGGKGDKDRVTCLPRALGMVLEAHMIKLRAMWERDRAEGAPPVWLPAGLERKFPNGGAEWPWFWMFPGHALSTDPRTGIVRRHHVHEDTLGKALKGAAFRAGIHKRVTAHTLRHSFATAMLRNGYDVRQLQELLGHAHLDTTMVYVHCLPLLGARVQSPLDMAAGGKVLAFPRAEELGGTRTERRAV